MSIIDAICNQLNNSEYKPNRIVMQYKHIPNELKENEIAFKDNEWVVVSVEKEKVVLKSFDNLDI